MRRLLFAMLMIPLLSGCVHVLKKAGRSIEKHQQRVRSLDAQPVNWEVRVEHPRLMLTSKQWTAQSKIIQTDPRLEKVINKAQSWMKQPLIQYDSKKLLVKSRDALKRIPTYAGLFRITGEKKYADAARKELINVCNFDDWQPSDFLATSEMMNAVAIGYDWIHDQLSEADRKTIAQAIIDNGLEPAIDAYASGGGWTTASHNWNLVCNSSIITASLAVIDDDPALARKMLALAMRSIKHGIKTYDDCQGGWPEGPMYHNYATRYAIFAAAALETAPIKPVQLITRQMQLAGMYRIQLTGPTGKSFNFGDGDEVIGNSAWMNWLGARYDTRFADFQLNESQDDPSIFDLIWTESRDDSKRMELSRAAMFPYCEVATLRSGWSKDDTFVAVKGGDNSFNHNHLDLGTFVLDMLGERFACELGADNYSMSGYLGNRRGDYLRSSTPGQNTLTIGDANQPLDARAVIAVLNLDEKSAKVDLTGAYPNAHSITRKITVRKSVVGIVDQVELKSSESIVWHMHTPASVEVQGNHLFLKIGDKEIEMVVRSPKNATIEVVEDKTKPPALPIEGIRDIRIIVPRAEKATFDIMFIASD